MGILAEGLIGEEGKVFRYVLDGMNVERVLLAANVCLDTFGGYGFVDEYDVERKFRETRMYQEAPVSNNMILAYLGQNVLKMPRSY